MRLLLLISTLLFSFSSYSADVPRIPEIPDVCSITCFVIDNNQNYYSGTDVDVTKGIARCKKEYAYQLAMNNCVEVTEDINLCTKVESSCK